MRMRAFAWASVLATLTASQADAQSSVITDVIGQTAAGMSGSQSDDCFNGHDFPKEGEIRNGRERSEGAMQKYLALARTGVSLTPAFVKEVAARHWIRDGSSGPVEQASDPWAARIARLEPTDFRAGNQKTSYRAIWKAYAADGSTIGLYEAFVHRTRNGASFIDLSLHSSNAPQPAAGEPFCSYPGDIEKWREAKAKRDAEKAARRAARD
jgi:hypothetical protein